MKRSLLSIGLVFFLFGGAQICEAQTLVWSQGISQTSVNLRGAPVALGQVNVDIPAAGVVIVRFDGDCESEVGDLIVLAASDTDDWSTNDGNVGVEAANSDVVNSSFSHTRAYPVAAGNHTFYAVAENFLEKDGSGVASIYGNLTVKFYSNTAGGATVQHVGIVEDNLNVRGAVVTVGQISLNPPAAGMVVVRFDGSCFSSPGDTVVLAASNIADWGVNDGTTVVEAVNADVNENSFSHTRVYEVLSGVYDFYAVAENFVETDGSGFVSIYGSLTVEYFPDTPGRPYPVHQGIDESSITVRGAPVTMGQVTLVAPFVGRVVLSYDGMSVSSAGDLIIHAASKVQDWLVNDGNVAVEAIDGDLNLRPFSHSRVYNVGPGSHTFYAVTENFLETDGTGEASVYASLTAQYFPAPAGSIFLDSFESGDTADWSSTVP